MRVASLLRGLAEHPAPERTLQEPGRPTLPLQCPSAPVGAWEGAAATCTLPAAGPGGQKASSGRATSVLFVSGLEGRAGRRGPPERLADPTQDIVPWGPPLVPESPFAVRLTCFGAGFLGA